jgi:hypothetical protein
MKNSNTPKETGKPYFPLFGFLMSAILPALGVALFFLPSHGYESYKVQSKADDWPKVSGRVISSEVIEDERIRVKDNKIGINDKNIGNKEDRYRADIWIQYEVNEKKYSINGLYIGYSETWTGNKSRVQKISNDYSVGRQVQVSYSPDEPHVAVVETNIKIISIVLFSLMLLCIFLGMWLLWLSFRDLYRFIKHYIVKGVR